MFSLEDGKYLLKLARRAIESYLEEGSVIPLPEDVPQKLMEKGGVFVTLQTYPGGDLRGCIGFPEPTYPLAEGVIRAAIASSVEDPRFPPMNREEQEEVILELSILTPPEKINAPPTEYPREISIGEHGLIVERGHARGLLLPQVPVEQGWDEEGFLAYTCMKAGMPGDCWKDEEVKVYRFRGILFIEKKPGGDVIEEKLGKRDCNF